MSHEADAHGDSNVFDELVADFLERIEAGEDVDAKAFASAHPEWHDELLAFIDDYRQMGGLLATPEPPAEADTQPVGHSPIEQTTGHVRSMPAAAAPQQLGDFELLDKIAEGGMGVVYRAHQVSLNRTVALKMIRSGQLADQEEVQRFHREAAAAARLDHPGIVPIYQVGEEAGQHYFAMAYVKGRSLADVVRDGRLAPRQAAEYVRKVALAVHYAHQQGIIHRDIKPGNVLVDEQDEPKVTDFGLAKELEGEHSLTASGQIVGTISYMPPEQASGTIRQVSTWSDVYSLGALLYALLTQRPPFQAENPLETLMKVISDTPLPPSRVGQRRWGLRDWRQRSTDASSWRMQVIPLDLDTICLKCLEKDPSKRYPSAAALADDLDRFLAGDSIQARPVRVVERTVRWCRRRPAVAGALALLSLLIVVAAIALTTVRSQAQDMRYLSAMAWMLGSSPQPQQPLDQVLLDRARAYYDQQTFDDWSVKERLHGWAAQIMLRQDAAARRSLLTQFLATATAAFAESPQDLSLRSSLADAHRLLGETYLAPEAARDPENAQEHFQAAIELLQNGPTSPQIANRLNGVQLRMIDAIPDHTAKWELLKTVNQGSGDADGHLIRFAWEPSPVAAASPQSPTDSELAELKAAAAEGFTAQLNYAQGLLASGEVSRARLAFEVAFTDTPPQPTPRQQQQLATAYRTVARIERLHHGDFAKAWERLQTGIRLRLGIRAAAPEIAAALRADFEELAVLAGDVGTTATWDIPESLGIWPDTPIGAYDAVIALLRTRDVAPLSSQP